VGGMPWWKVGCLGLGLVVILGFVAVQALVGFVGGDRPIDGMKCGIGMNGHHVHAHLSLFDVGHQVFLYDGIAWSQQGHCWYWLHTHDGSGVIHVEGPDSAFHPTLASFSTCGTNLSRGGSSFPTTSDLVRVCAST